MKKADNLCRNRFCQLPFFKAIYDNEFRSIIALIRPVVAIIIIPNIVAVIISGYVPP